MKIFHALVALASISFLAAANHYETSIGTNKACYSRGEPIYVHFVNQGCRRDDWVGIYPAGTNVEALPEDTLKMWVWTCGRQRKQCNVEYASIKFNSDRQEAYTDIWPLKEGQYIATLARNSDSPYSGTAASSIFTVQESCELGDDDDDDDDESDNSNSPSHASPQFPTYNPTPMTPLPTTSAPTTPKPTPGPTSITSAPVVPPTNNPTPFPMRPKPITPVPETPDPTLLTSPPTPAPSPAPTFSPVTTATLPPTLVPLTVDCPATPNGACSVCGQGKCVGNPSAIFSFPDQPPVDCGTLQQAGLQGLIPLDQCVLLPNLIELCDCREGQSNTGGGCSVCGEGKSVGNANAIFNFPDQPAVPCGTLELAGKSGIIPAEECKLLPGLIRVCECRAD